MTQTTHPIVGTGNFKYQAIHNWLTPPANIVWGETHGVAQDAQGRIYIGHTVGPESKSPDAIVVFDDQGKFITSWGPQFKGGAHGLDIRKEGSEEFLYHCDVAHNKVTKTTLNGEVLWEKTPSDETRVYKPGEKSNATNIGFAPNGDFYIADGYGSHYITQYDIKGEFIRGFGGTGSEPGKLKCPHGVAVDLRGPTPTLVVADRGNNRLQYFTLDGQHLHFVTTGQRQPCHFDFRGDLMLIPDLSSQITIMDKNNQVAAHLGDGHPSKLRGQPASAFIPGQFIHPHGARFLKNGDILVAEWVPQGRITLLKKID